MWQGGIIGREACVVGGMHGRGCTWQGACMAGECMAVACMSGGCVAGGHGMHLPTDTTRYGDTVNERVVRILLECIFVLNWL